MWINIYSYAFQLPDKNLISFSSCESANIFRKAGPQTTAIESAALLWRFYPIHRFKEIIFEGSLMCYTVQGTMM